MLIETALIIVIMIVVITEFIKSIYPMNKKEMFQEGNLMKRNLDPSFRLREIDEMPWQQQ
jgi:hypothetical protein